MNQGAVLSFFTQLNKQTLNTKILCQCLAVVDYLTCYLLGQSGWY